MTRRTLVKLGLAVFLTAFIAPALQAGPLSVTEFQGNTAPNSISIVSFAPGTLTFQVTTSSGTTSLDPTIAAGVNGSLNEVNGTSIFPGPNVHAGDPGGSFTLSYTLDGPVFSDPSGDMFQDITITGTSSDNGVTPLPYIPLNIQDGVGGTTYAELGLTGLSAVVEDAADGSHSLILLTAADYQGQTGPSTTYDFTPFENGGTGSYTLTNPSASAGSLISFVQAGVTGNSGTYALLSNGFTATAALPSPEPMTLSLLCTGMPLLVYVSRRRKRQGA
jgi:hypothetical protein